MFDYVLLCPKSHALEAELSVADRCGTLAVSKNEYQNLKGLSM